MTNFILGVLVGVAGIMAYKIRVEVVRAVDVKATTDGLTVNDFDMFYDLFRDPDEGWDDLS